MKLSAAATILAAVAVLLVGIGVGIWLRTREEAGDRLLVRRLEELEHRLKQSERSSGPAGGGSQSGGRPRAMSAPSTGDATSRADRRFELIQGVFEQEDIDEEWAPAVERTIAQRVSDLSGSQIVSAECRFTMCRIEAQHNGSRDREEFMDLVVTVPEVPRATIRRLGDSGGLERTLVYLVRRGHEMPRLPRPGS